MEDVEEFGDTRLLKEFDTIRGNTLQIKSTNPFGLFKINYKNAGDMPDVLKGGFTKLSYAVEAVIKYLPTIKEPYKEYRKKYKKSTVDGKDKGNKDI